MNNTFVPVNCARRKTDWNTLSPAESAIATDIITSRAFDGIVKDDEAFTGPAFFHSNLPINEVSLLLKGENHEN
jgi:hypothetical protein